MCWSDQSHITGIDEQAEQLRIRSLLITTKQIKRGHISDTAARSAKVVVPCLGTDTDCLAHPSRPRCVPESNLVLLDLSAYNNSRLLDESLTNNYLGTHQSCGVTVSNALGFLSIAFKLGSQTQFGSNYLAIPVPFRVASSEPQNIAVGARSKRCQRAWAFG